MELENLTDLDLIERILNGESELFEHIVVRYRSLCMSYIYKMVRNQCDSEDLVQDTFMRSFSALKQFSAKGKFSSWLLRIAHNICMAFFNKRKNYKVDGNIEIENLGEKGIVNKSKKDHNPLDITIQSEFLNSVNHAISELPAIHKSCILLRYMIDLVQNVDAGSSSRSVQDR